MSVFASCKSTANPGVSFEVKVGMPVTISNPNCKVDELLAMKFFHTTASPIKGFGRLTEYI
jgi:hypothetical protein